jgi:hypothetical protein
VIEGQQRSLPGQRDQADSDTRMFVLRSDHAKAQYETAGKSSSHCKPGSAAISSVRPA